MGSNITQSQETVIARFKEAHGDRYDYSKVVFSKATAKVEIICSQHGSFWQSANAHYNGKGCKSCAMQISINAAAKVRSERKAQDIPFRHRKTQEQFIKDARLTHASLYDYSQVIYRGNKTEITVICNVHGPFAIKPIKHLLGGGCQRCAVGKQTSKIADTWLDHIGIKLEYREFRLPERPSRKVDGFDPETNTCYQFHGDFFHGNPAIHDPAMINPRTKTSFGDLYSKTNERDQEIRDLGYKLVVMWENEWEAVLRRHKRLKEIWS